MAASAWSSVILYSAVHTGNTFAISFCGGNVVDQFFCEIPQLLHLTCSDSYLREIVVISFHVLLGLICFAFITLSYVQIYKTVLKIPSEQGQHKALSTCLPHLTVVSFFLFTGTFAFLKRTSNSTSDLNLLVALLYSLLPRMMNLNIYSMRNKEMKGALSKLIGWSQNLWVFFSKLNSTVCRFLTNLSLLDVLLTSMVIPMVSNQEMSSFPSYHAQAYFHFLMDSMEFFLFRIMSSDFQMAITYLLQYLTIVSNRVCLCLVAASW
ncbi:unnamed protein product [Caretta caretta]